jgi:rod shape-determining protein MreD
VTLLFSLLLDLLPLGGAAALLWPDCLALTLLYWVVHYPRRVGMGIAWFLGLLMDIAEGALFGQHALAYVVIAYGAWLWHRRLQTLSPWQQALYVCALLLAMQCTMLGVRLSFGDTFPGFMYFAAAVVGAVSWPLIALLLQLPARNMGEPPSYGTPSR